ncbi:MAG: RNA-binding domain-containing protein [Verrucomicrobiota bacterium]
MKTVDRLLQRLEELIRLNRFEELETETIEIKPVPSTRGEWTQIAQSVMAFLNARGGILLLGIKEEQQPQRQYRITGWRPEAEEQVAALGKRFTDRRNQALDLCEWIPQREVREFMGERILILYVDELPAERKFCFLNGEARDRVLTGDRKISEERIATQEEYKEDAWQSRELTPVSGATLEDINLDRLNEYIQLLNRQVKIETIKADLSMASSFLSRKGFIVDGKVTTLGMLVCGTHPADRLDFRCRVHGYVEVPQVVAQDKQVFADNVLPLMDASLGYILRNIQVGVSAESGGSSQPQYPEALLRETVNNALAHRDYSINKYITITIRPGRQIEIRNPGTLRASLLIDVPEGALPLRRIIPEAKPRNPKLASVLMVYNKWEGKGIGMATLTNLCLQNAIDLPYYRLYSEDELGLCICAGKLLDDRMEELFRSFDGYLESKMQGRVLTEEQKRILAYLIKSEWANRLLRYTIILTPDNNHFNELNALETAGLISRHPNSPPLHPVYVADRILVKEDYTAELRTQFGPLTFDPLGALLKDALGIIYRVNHFSKVRWASARQVALVLWGRQSEPGTGARDFEGFYRKVKYAFNKLEKAGMIRRDSKKPRYEIITTPLQPELS